MQQVRDPRQWLVDRQRNERRPAMRLKTSFIPAKYHSSTWDDYDGAVTAVGALGKPEQLKEILIDFARRWESGWDGLVVLGAPGAGKTMGVALIGLDLLGRDTDRPLVKFITEERLNERERDLIGLARAAEDTGDDSALEAATNSLWLIREGCDVLILDDIGKAYRSASGWQDTRLDALLRMRVELGKTTIITSNVPASDWSRFHPSMSSFLFELGEVINVIESEEMRTRRMPSSARGRSAAR